MPLGRVALGLGDGDACRASAGRAGRSGSPPARRRSGSSAGRPSSRCASSAERGPCRSPPRRPASSPLRSLLDRDAAAAAGDDQHAFAREALDDRRLDHAHRLRRGDRRAASRGRRPASPSSRARRRARRATSSVMNEPIGLSGCANAGSSRSTSVCVTSVTTGSSMPRALQRVAERVLEHEADRALRVGDGVVASAPSGTSPSAISERRRMKPTCGPLPCVSTTFQPARSCRRRAWRWRTPRRTGRRATCAASSRISALPPTATTASGLLIDRLAFAGDAARQRLRPLR